MQEILTHDFRYFNVSGVVWNEPGLQSAAGTLWKLALLRQCVLDSVLDKSWTLMSDRILAQVIKIVTI